MPDARNLSNVAGILDPYGGIRTVVEKWWAFHHHAKPYEKICVVPGFFVEEPVPWEMIPYVVRRAEKAVDDWIEKIGVPNDPDLQEAVVMRRLRKLEHPVGKKALNLELIVET